MINYTYKLNNKGYTMTHYNVTDGTKFRIEGQDFKVVDTREYKTMFQSDVSYFGMKRAALITSDGLGDRENYSEAIVLNHGDIVWIDGEKFYVVLLNSKCSDGVKFITAQTYEAIIK